MPIIINVFSTTMEIQANMSLRRDDSYELEIFDAKRYFSGSVDGDFSFANSFNYSTKDPEEPPKTTPKKEKKKSTLSSSVRLAGFLNSLFNQALLSRKKSTPKRSTMEEENNKKGGRSSIGSSHSTRLTESKAIHSICESEFTTWRSWRRSRRGEEVVGEEGWESDSSSDLFELKNYDSEAIDALKRSRNRRHSDSSTAAY